MGKGVVFGILLALFAFALIYFGFFYFTGLIISDKDIVDNRVYEELEKSEDGKVPVVVEINEDYSRVFEFARKSPREIREDVIKSVEDKAKRKFIYSNSFAAELSENDIEKLAGDKRVKYVAYDYPVRAFLQDSVPLINATPTWDLQVNGANLTGKGQAVCVIDTGIDYNHTDLGGCFGENNASSDCRVLGGYDFVNEDGDPADDNGHGTHVAGIVAANGSIKGVAPDAKLIAIKSLDSGGSGSFSDVASGIEWCTNNATSFNITAISMSLGTESPDIFNNFCDSDFSSTAAAINAAFAKNISVVVATGNDGNITHISSPACIQNVTRIGWTTKEPESIASASNRWSLEMLVAPGSSINSTKNGGGYEAKSGTSMATPHVSGAIAIIRQYLELVSKTRTPLEIESVLNSTGKKINDTGGNKLNYSRIDVYEAILFLDEAPLIQFVEPAEANNSFLGRNYIQANVTAEGLGSEPDTITIFLYNSTSLVSKSSNTTSPHFFNFTNLQEEAYFLNATVNNTIGNENSTSTRTITLTKPILTIERPRNETYFNNEALDLKFSVDAEGETWYNIDQGSNETITGNTSVEFNTTEGQHTLYLFANNSFGENSTSVIFTVNTSKFSVNYSNFDGDSTAFNKSSFEEIQNLSGVVLENTESGKIEFNESVNLTNITGDVIDINSYVDISFNRIEINSTALPNFNKSATLNLYNLTFSDPRVLRDGSACPSTICTQVSYSGGILKFNVTQFSVYSAEETPIVSPSSGGGGGGGGTTSSSSTAEEPEETPIEETPQEDEETAVDTEPVDEELARSIYFIAAFAFLLVLAVIIFVILRRPKKKSK